MLAKFHGNMLNLSENIAKSFSGATFLTHTVDRLSAAKCLMIGRVAERITLGGGR